MAVWEAGSAEAWEKVSPQGFDLSSGIEDSPGVKNHDLMCGLLAAFNRLN